MKLYKISSKDDVDPDSKTTDGADPKNKKQGTQGNNPDPKKTEKKTGGKRLESPKDKVWADLKKVVKVVGKALYEQAKKEAGVAEIWKITEAKAVLLAIDMLANRADNKGAE